MPATRIWTWQHLVVVTAARAVLAGLLGLAAWGALPATIGWHPTTVSSGSMMPRLHVGDVAVSRPLGTHVPPLGSVLLFDDPDHPGRLRMHRFVRLADDGLLVTRGDANPADDSSPVPLASVRGIGTLRVPWVALPIIWLRGGRWVSLGLVAAGLALLLALSVSGRDRGFADDDLPGGPDGGPGGDGRGDDPNGDGPPRSSPAVDEDSPCRAPAHRSEDLVDTVVRRVSALVAVVLLAGALVAPADAAFASTTSTRASLAASTYFSCTNALTAFGPSIWYRMDETSSTTTSAADSSGNALTGVYSAAGKTSTTARACTRDSGRAMTYDGSSGYLSSPLLNVSLPNTFTLSIWFRTTTARGGKLIGFGNSQTGVSSTYDRHIYMTNAGKLIFGVYTGGVKTVTSTAALNDGAWHLSVATLSSAGLQLYVDGDLVASDSTVTTAEAASSGYVRIAYDNLDGWVSVPTSRYFAGTLDDAAVYTSALSATQVQALYQAGTA